MRSQRFSLVDLAMATSFVAIVTVILTPAVLNARTASRQQDCANHFKMIGIALHNYHATHLLFPPGRIWDSDPLRPAHDNGATLMALPYIEQEAVYNAFNFYMAWSTVQNKTACNQRIAVFLCPDAPMHSMSEKVDPVGGPTSIAYSLGSLAWLTHPTHAAAKLGPQPEGVFFDNSAIGAREIVDGMSMTVFASEQIIDANRRDGSAEMTGECSGAATEGKQHFERSGSRWAAGHPSSNYFNARRRPNDAESDCFHGTPVGIGSLNKVPRSRHVGGVNVLFADGSVKFVRDSIDLRLWQSLNTRAAQEVVDPASF